MHICGMCNDSSVDSLVVMAVDAEGVFDGYMLGTDEVDEEVDFSKMKPLPESYIDSDSAMVIASEMGGDRFLDYYSTRKNILVGSRLICYS